MRKSSQVFGCLSVGLAFCFLPAILAFNWAQGDKGATWAAGCDWSGGDIGNTASSGQDCGAKCSDNSACTHFTWTNWHDGTCWMKHFNNAPTAVASNSAGAVCGWITRGGNIGAGSRQIIVKNNCGKEIWVSPLTNNNGPSLPGGIQKLTNGASFTYQIPNGEWGGRFWPKLQCDGSGQNCAVGQSTSPCPSGGCQPPADTKVEFHYPPTGSSDGVWYDVSLVDGYSLSAKIEPNRISGSCVVTSCMMSLNDCPTNENNGIGDLRVFRSGAVTSCFSPCKKWNYPAPFGLNRKETDEPGQSMCCPTPPVSPQQCSSGIVRQTQYVNLIHRTCPSAYSYAYDDEAGLHVCPNDSGFLVTFCP